jgi:cephalosporin hydroxylase
MGLKEFNGAADIQRLNTLMSRINLAKTVDNFRQRRWSSIPEYPIFYSLIALYDVDNVVECGTNAGASALSFAAGLMNTGKSGKVYTWDVDVIDGVDVGTNLEDRVVRHLEPFVQAKININPRGKLLIFIDGDHAYESALADLQHTKTFIQPGDVLVVHDVFKHPPVKDAVVDFLKGSKRYIEIPSSAGIGVILW